MRVKAAVVGFTCFLLSCSSASADYALHYWENRRADRDVLSATEELSFFTSTNNFESQGDVVQPAGLNRYWKIENRLNLIYGLNSRLSTYGTLAWAHADVDHSTRPGSSYGLTDQTLGFNFNAFSFENSKELPSPSSPGDSNALRKIEFQAEISFPSYTNATADSLQIPRLGDQSIDTTAGIFATLRLIRSQSTELLLTSGAGYTYRSQGFSASVPWSIALQYTPVNLPGTMSQPPGYGFSQGMQGSLWLIGNYSLQTDSRNLSSSSNFNSSPSLGTGGSYITGAINPTLVTLRGKISYAIDDQLMVSTDLTQTLMGNAAVNGFSGALSIQKLFGLSPSRKLPTEMTPDEYGKSNKGFLEYGFEARVLRSVDRLNLVKIDKGSSDGVAIDQIFDIFAVKSNGTLGEPIARAKVISTKNNEAALTVLEYFKETWIEEGYLAKRPLQ